MNINDTTTTVEISVDLYAELVEARTMVEIIKRKTAASKYSIDRQFIADITGIELPDVKNEGGEF